MTRVAFYNLGCKVNQFDSAALQSDLSQDNTYTQVPFDAEADIYVVNTCTVTGKSDMEARRIIRKAIRRNRRARIVVTGCYAQTNPDEIAKIEGVSLILGNQEKFRLREYLDHFALSCTESGMGGGETVRIETQGIEQPGPLSQPKVTTTFASRARALLKVQDGCNSRCSFCIIPDARGRSRSLPLNDVLHQMRVFEAAGYREVVLTGIHLGSYGRDLDSRISLVSLLDRIVAKTRLPRIRLSSIEPREVTPELATFMAAHRDRMCRHLHIPLQSGDDAILRRMNRNYSSSFYRDLILFVSERVGEMGIGADVMVGFPGEGDGHFDQTYRLIDGLPITYLHTFPYSPRLGTAALNLSDPVEGRVKQERARRLRELGYNKEISFISKQIRVTVNVLVEESMDAESGLPIGYTDTYIRVILKEERGVSAGAPPDPRVSVPAEIRGIRLSGDGAPVAVGNRISP